MFQIKAVEKIEIQNLRSVTFFSPRKACRERDNVKKFSTAREAGDDNMAARCMLG